MGLVVIKINYKDLSTRATVIDEAKNSPYAAVHEKVVDTSSTTTRMSTFTF